MIRSSALWDIDETLPVHWGNHMPTVYKFRYKYNWSSRLFQIKSVTEKSFDVKSYNKEITICGNEKPVSNVLFVTE